MFSYAQFSFQCSPYGEVGLRGKTGKYQHKDEVQEEIESSSQYNCLICFPRICIVKIVSISGTQGSRGCNKQASSCTQES